MVAGHNGCRLIYANINHADDKAKWRQLCHIWGIDGLLYLCKKIVMNNTFHVMKRYWFISFLSLLIYLLVAPLRGGYITLLGLTGFPLSLLAGCILFFIFTIIMLEKLNNKVSKNGILLAVLLGILILELPVRATISFNSSLMSLPDASFKVLAVVVAYGVFKIKKIFCKIAVSILFFASCFWFSYYGYGYYGHKLSYGSFTGEAELFSTKPLIFQNDTNEDVYLSDIDGSYLVLDFWTSSCGVCFKMFPEVQRVYERYNNEQVQVYSIFCRDERREETTVMGTEMLHKRGYTFPSLSIDGKDPILTELGVTGFPTVLIFDKDRTMVFRGSILLSEKFLKKALLF